MHFVKIAFVQEMMCSQSCISSFPLLEHNESAKHPQPRRVLDIYMQKKLLIFHGTQGTEAFSISIFLEPEGD